MNQENESRLILRVKKFNKKNWSMLTQINIYCCDWFDFSDTLPQAHQKLWL